jgi:hypothetical protein
MILGSGSALLIALQSIYEIAYGGGAASWNVYGIAVALPTLGAIGGFESAVLLGASLLLYEFPHLHSTAGVALLTFALLSLFSGGGFILGALCGYVAGLLALSFSPGPRRRPTPESLREASEDPVAEADVLDSLRSS